MKNIVIKSGVMLLLATLLMQGAIAQRQGRKRTNNNNNTQPKDTTGQPGQQQINNVTQPSNYNPYGNIPIVIDSSGVSDTVVKKSLRNLIFTDKYERVFRPDVGCNVRALLFSNMTPESLIAIKDTIRDTIDKYEPRVAIQEIQVVAQPDQNGVVINIIFQILNIPQTQFLSITIDRAR